MVAERRKVDLDDDVKLHATLDRIEDLHQPIELQRRGKTVAILTPIDDSTNLEPKRGTVESLMRFAGAIPDGFLMTLSRRFALVG